MTEEPDVGSADKELHPKQPGQTSAVAHASSHFANLLDYLFVMIKAIKQYFPVALFVLLYSVVLTFESVDETLKCNHSNESY